MTQESKRRTVSASYQLFMLGLCLYALAALAGQSAMQLEARTRRILDYADSVVRVMFFADFVVSLLSAPTRWRYFVTWGWLDLISSIPMIDVTRWGRAARIVRVLRVLRGLREEVAALRRALEQHVQPPPPYQRGGAEHTHWRTRRTCVRI